MDQVLESNFDVNVQLEKFRQEARQKLKEAWEKTNVRYDDAQKNFSKICDDNPDAVVKIDGKDSHLFLILMDETHEFVDSELKKVGSRLLETKIEARHRVRHEFDHAGAVIGLDKDVTGYGVLVCLDKDNLIDTMPFISHEHLPPDEAKIVALAPRDYHSPGDIEITSRLD